MNLEQFINQNREQWKRLEDILQRTGKGKLNHEELLALAPLYRQTVSHLAQAQSVFPDSELTIYLNNLIVQAHGLIYRKEGLEISKIWKFLWRGFPKLCWEQGFWIMISFLIMFLGFGLGIVLYYVDISLAAKLIPGNLQDIMNGLQKGQVGTKLANGQKPLISAAIMINNIKVAIMVFAFGITGGIGTALVLLINGLILGVLAALFWQYKHSLDFWSLIVPHGVIEITAIIIAGAAGFIIGKALVKPGVLSRKDALRVAGLNAIQILLGVIPFFVIAAIIEGFITPTEIAPNTKVYFGAVTAILLILYLGRGYWQFRKEVPKQDEYNVRR